jgi:hypothetical protein
VYRATFRCGVQVGSGHRERQCFEHRVRLDEWMQSNMTPVRDCHRRYWAGEHVPHALFVGLELAVVDDVCALSPSVVGRRCHQRTQSMTALMVTAEWGKEMVDLTLDPSVSFVVQCRGDAGFPMRKRGEEGRGSSII